MTGMRTTPTAVPLAPKELREKARVIIGALAVPPTRTPREANDALVAIESSHERLRLLLEAGATG